MRAWFGVPALMAVCLVAAQQPEDTLEPPGQQEAAVVVIGLSGDGITATPSVVVANRGQPVEWRIAAGAGIDRFQVRFQSGRPFGAGASQQGLNSNRQGLPANASPRARAVVSGNAEVGVRYKYDVRVWTGQGQPLLLDPEVEIGTGGEDQR